MKKTFFTLYAFIYSTGLFAQLYVNSDGKVGIGDTASTSATISVDVNDNDGFEQNMVGGYSSIRIANKGDAMYRYGIYMRNHLRTNTYSDGIRIIPDGFSNWGSCGVFAQGGYTTGNSCGIAGTITAAPVSYAAGIYGSSGTYLLIPSSYPGKFAGFFRGDVRITGTLYADLLTPSALSNSSGNDEFSSVQVVSKETDAADECVSDKISKVQLLRITNNAESEKIRNIRGNNNTFTVEKNAKMKEALLSREEVDYETFDIQDNTDSEEEEVPQTPKASVRYGLAADQLKEVFPELVYEDANGNVSINYIEMIPLLVQSVNELKEEVESLKKEKAELMAEESTANKAREQITSVSGTADDVDILSLSQNDPNPFSDKTNIRVNVPEGISTAALFIYDMSGKQIRKIQITERGASSVSITSADLNEGMYLYSLIADGKIVNTKKMILTK